MIRSDTIEWKPWYPHAPYAVTRTHNEDLKAGPLMKFAQSEVGPVTPDQMEH